MWKSREILFKRDKDNSLDFFWCHVPCLLVCTFHVYLYALVKWLDPGFLCVPLEVVSDRLRWRIE